MSEKKLSFLEIARLNKDKVVKKEVIIDEPKKEINNNMCPMSITRKLRNNTMEIWSVNEMIKPNI